MASRIRHIRPKVLIVNRAPTAEEIAAVAGAVSRVQAPQWEFQGVGGDCGPGKFVTDAPTAEETTMIQMDRQNLAGSDSSWLASVSAGGILLFTGEGGTAGMQIVNMQTEDSDPEGCFMIGVRSVGGNLTWEGVYSVQNMTTA